MGGGMGGMGGMAGMGGMGGMGGMAGMGGLMPGMGGLAEPGKQWQILATDFPPMETPSGRRMVELQKTPGNVRHDIVIAKGQVGRLIGSGGTTYKELQNKTGCNIFILDKEGPAPGFPEDQRLVVLIGRELQVSCADAEIQMLLTGTPSGVPQVPMMSAGGELDQYTLMQTMMQQQAGGTGTVLGSGAEIGVRLFVGFPPADTPTGRRMAILDTTPGIVRHDILIAKSYVGRLIGSGGTTYKELQMKTGCNIFILDKEGPAPGCPEDQRAVVLMGSDTQVAHAEMEVQALLTYTPGGPPTIAAMNPGSTDAVGPQPAPYGAAVDTSAQQGLMALPAGYAGPQPGPAGSTVTSSPSLAPGFPGPETPTGRRMVALEATPGMLRTEMLISKASVGRLIGSGGTTYKELQSKTGCNIFILDKEGPPPGFPEDQRMVVFIGAEQQVAHAEVEVQTLLQTSLKMPGAAAAMSMAAARQPSMFNPPNSYNPAPFCDLTTRSSHAARGTKRGAPE